MFRPSALAAVIALAVMPGPGWAAARAPARATRAPVAVRAAEPASRPFDYYVLSLSWSPEFCAERPGVNSEQCRRGRHFGFVVQGLWPQYAPSGAPQSCQRTGPVPADIVRSMLPIMPSPQRVSQEWRLHGTCSGLGVADYFSQVTAAFGGILIPGKLTAPRAPLAITKREVERLFMGSNHGLAPEMMSLVCNRKLVTELRFCLGKDLRFRACGKDMGDRCGNEVMFRPIR